MRHRKGKDRQTADREPDTSGLHKATCGQMGRMSKRSRSRSSSLSPPSSPGPSTPIPGPSKTPQLQDTADSTAEVMRCSLPPHRETFSFPSYADYEVHYRQAHVNRCAECGKNFPTERFLELHIEENHDPLTAAKRERGDKTYGCFIEDCERKCSTPQKRRLHLIDKHMFPRTYNFFIVNDGIDKQTSMLRPPNSQGKRRLSITPTSPQEGRLRNRQTSISNRSTASSSLPPPPLPPPQSSSASKSDEMDIVELEQSMSALRFVPVSVARNRQKSGK